MELEIFNGIRKSWKESRGKGWSVSEKYSKKLLFRERRMLGGSVARNGESVAGWLEKTYPGLNGMT